MREGILASFGWATNTATLSWKSNVSNGSGSYMDIEGEIYIYLEESGMEDVK